MSTKRRESAKRIKNADGVTVCSCGCGQIPKPPRQTWFSKACVDQWRSKNDPAFIRQQLKERDKGICAACGCDAQVEYQKYLASHKEASRLLRWFEDRRERENWLKRDPSDLDPWKTSRHALWPECNKGGKTCYKTLHAMRDLEISRLGVLNPGWTTGRKTAWDADHILEVVNGGGLCGLDNYQTLCHPCHKAKTAKLAASLAIKRRRVKERLNADLFTINTLP
jgi:5-methylcytosine-specific restriction endonuclease McrA